MNGTNGSGSKALMAPARNRYAYGIMLTERLLQREQRYFNDKRWLLNRYGLGRGVLCGLELVVGENGGLWLRPGLAVDGYGREIIVPTPYCIDNPRQATDEYGRPDGDPLEGAGTLTLCLHYHECETEPVPVLVGDCDTDNQCAPSTIRERYRLQLVMGAPASPPTGLSDEECAAAFPALPADNFDRRTTICDILSGSCTDVDQACVTIGTIAFAEDGSLTADTCTYRDTLYSNDTLFELLLCLADRVDNCCDTYHLEYVAGDGQSAAPGTELPEALTVRVLDHNNDPVRGEAVRFRLRSGGGSMSTDEDVSDNQGEARTVLTLGPNPGLNTVEAVIDDGSSVHFVALGLPPSDPPPTDEPPRVMAVWPPNAANLFNRENEEWLGIWLDQARIQVTFDTEMDENQLTDRDQVNQWLRVWQLTDLGEIEFQRMELDLISIGDDSILGQEGQTATYALGNFQGQPRRNQRFVILMEAEGGNITSVDGLTLDAEFIGSRLTQAQRQLIWEIDGNQIFGQRDLWDALVNTNNTLPRSGDGDEGGSFNSWFELVRIVD